MNYAEAVYEWAEDSHFRIALHGPSGIPVIDCPELKTAWSWDGWDNDNGEGPVEQEFYDWTHYHPESAAAGSETEPMSEQEAIAFIGSELQSVKKQNGWS